MFFYSFGSRIAKLRNRGNSSEWRLSNFRKVFSVWRAPWKWNHTRELSRAWYLLKTKINLISCEVYISEQHKVGMYVLYIRKKYHVLHVVLNFCNQLKYVFSTKIYHVEVGSIWCNVYLFRIWLLQVNKVDFQSFSKLGCFKWALNESDFLLNCNGLFFLAVVFVTVALISQK